MLLFVLLLMGVSFAASTDTPVQTAPPGALRVMTFNIRNSNARDGANHWKFRKELVTKTIRAFNPDLLGCQEVLADQFDQLSQMLPDYVAVGVARDDGKRKGEWSAIFYRSQRFERVNAGDFWLSEKPEEVGNIGWDAACVRICTWAKLKDRTTGTELLYANTHFDHKGKVARLESARLITRQLSRLAEGVPVILTGDFNCTEDHPPYQALTAPTADDALKLMDSYRHVHPNRSPEEASFHAFKGTTAGSRIDWILHSPAFQAISAEIVRTDGERHASDHYPVTAILEVVPR